MHVPTREIGPEGALFEPNGFDIRTRDVANVLGSEMIMSDCSRTTCVGLWSAPTNLDELRPALEGALNAKNLAMSMSQVSSGLTGKQIGYIIVAPLLEGEVGLLAEQKTVGVEMLLDLSDGPALYGPELWALTGEELNAAIAGLSDESQAKIRAQWEMKQHY